jgi:hypothetical protein
MPGTAGGPIAMPDLRFGAKLRDISLTLGSFL